MKHLKIFENEKKRMYWIVIYQIKCSEANIILYPDEESAKNSIIMTINEERDDYVDEYTEDMIFTDCDDALDWYQRFFSDIDISYERIILSSHFELSSEVKMLKQSRKYNL